MERFFEKYLYQVSLRKFEAPMDDVPNGAKYRYYSGVAFDERPRVVAVGTGTASTKIAGQEGTRIAGQEGTRIAGQEGTRIAGQEGTRIAGQEGTRLAGGGAGTFFQSMRLFKNVESRWDISGFTKKPDETDHPLSSNAKAGSTNT